MKVCLIYLINAFLTMFAPNHNSDSIKFNNYYTKLYTGVYKKVNFRNNGLAKMYKTRILEMYSSRGLNFAGHYSLLWWGCGSQCQHCAIVDVITGKVYDGPTSSKGFNYKKNSSLLIVNPVDNDCAFCGKEHFLWKERTKTFVKL